MLAVQFATGTGIVKDRRCVSLMGDLNHRPPWYKSSQSLTTADTFNHQIFSLHMSAIFILIVISLIVSLGFLFAFLWAIRSDQYEDDYTPSVRILFDEHDTPNS